jgi:hypothetical protein
MISLEEFHTDFFNRVGIAADATGSLLEDAFFDLVCGEIVEAGDIETADRAYYAARGIRVDGYAGDPGSEDGTLTLIVADFNQSPTIENLDGRRLLQNFARLQTFLERSRDRTFMDEHDESTPVFGLCTLVAGRWSAVRRVRMLLITNRLLATRMDGLKAEDYEGRQITYSVWDIGRLLRLDAGRGREEIEVDFCEQFGAGLPALRAHLPDDTYGVYLAVVPGEQLAEIYGRWGARLLEQNVRAFLQARGSVNRGIRNPLENQPEMFLAYNNGITATAESVETEAGPDGLSITRVRNLQIVNGGQTTASVHAASLRPNADLSRVFVEMKLSVIDPAIAADVVPKISEYANSQNRVNAADFFSNHPFHVRIEEFSRRITAPSSHGGFTGSKWFYERARGQYQDARANRTAAQRAQFDLEYPKHQVFVKTDLAKFLNTWNGLPHVVSAGAQKNFVAFAEFIGREWDRDDTQFNEQYYRDTIAKAILFRRTEKIVSQQSWYAGGYRANIVVYSIAKLVHDAAKRELVLDLGMIWREQALPERVEAQLAVAAKVVNDTLTDTTRNVTEYAKTEAAWHRVTNAPVPWPAGLADDLSTMSEQRQKESAGRKDQVVLNGIEAQTRVIGKGPAFWEEVRRWAHENGEVTEKDEGILRVAMSSSHVPTERQSLALLEALRRYCSRGCPLGEDLP